MTYLHVINTAWVTKRGFMTCFILITSNVWPGLASSPQIADCQNWPCVQKAAERKVKVKVGWLRGWRVHRSGGAGPPDHHGHGSLPFVSRDAEGQAGLLPRPRRWRSATSSVACRIEAQGGFQTSCSLRFKLRLLLLSVPTQTCRIPQALSPWTVSQTGRWQ